VGYSRAMARHAACLLALLAPVLLAQDEEKTPPPPVLVAKSDAAFVHALRQAVIPQGWGLRGGEREGYDLLHTNRKTGEMKRLIRPTGTFSVPTRRLSYVVARMIGVAADAERLYVVLWQSGRIFDRPPAADAPVEGGRYELQVFWLADGSRIAAPWIDPENWPKAAPPETVEAGPLKLVKGGIQCYGVTGRYEGKELRAK